MPSDPSTGDNRSRATLSEVAELADVSISTVSKVLNGRSGVSSETRARIEELLQNHQYNRRASKRVRAALLEVLCYEIGSPFASEVLASVEAVARRRRIGMVVTGATEKHLPQPAWVDDVLERQPVGVILVACKLPVTVTQRLRSHGIALVMVDPAGTPAMNVPSIGSAGWDGGHHGTLAPPAL